LGLDQNDRIIKRRLAQKISFLKQESNREEPKTNQLVAFYEANKNKYFVPTTYSFTHYYFAQSLDAKPKALGALKNLKNQEAKIEAEPFFLGKNFNEYSLGEIEQAFGIEFLNAFENPRLNEWIGPFRSSYGEHLLYINNKKAGYLPEFNAIEVLIRQDFAIQEQEQRLSDYIDSVKAEYKVIINPNYQL
jgi:hypothetical protein